MIPASDVSHEKKAYHALATTCGGEYAKIKARLEKYGSAEEAWRNEASKLSLGALWEPLSRAGIDVLLPSDNAFPKILKEMSWPPLGLYIQGAPLLEEVRVAIVGTRRVTPEGKKVAEEFAHDLARAGISVVSGLALGVDGAAHKGALRAHGKTIAVLPSPLDRVYPREHDRLAEEIISSGGTLISEYPPDSSTYPSRFIERNRIVSALSKGTIIIEAPQKSGALATARFAIEQNREVFVVPGPVKHPNYAGSHSLIRDGAELVRSAEDVLQSLGVLPIKSEEKLARIWETLDETKKAILNCLHIRAESLTADEIAAEAKISPAEAQRELALLVIEGTIRENNDGTYLLNI